MAITHFGSGICSYTVLITGSIFFVTVPAIIIQSDWRGDARKMMPKRSRSLWDAPVAIISIAQHAKPNVIGQMDDFRDQLTNRSSDVVITLSPIGLSTPIPALLFSRHKCNQQKESQRKAPSQPSQKRPVFCKEWPMDRGKRPRYRTG